MTSPSPTEVSARFIHAVAWGEHLTVWELLALEGRKTVLRVALGRGMDDVLASRLREDRAEPDELNAFLTDLVNGLRADLAGADLDTLGFDEQPSEDSSRAAVVLTTPTDPELTRHGIDSLPVATVRLVLDGATWLVTGIEPRRAR